VGIAAITPFGEQAETYYRWLLNCLIQAEADIPTIAPLAEAAARSYVTGRYGLVAGGDRGFAGEATGRSGGFIALHPILRTSRIPPPSIDLGVWRCSS
jgi:hypothetical protein